MVGAESGIVLEHNTVLGSASEGAMSLGRGANTTLQDHLKGRLSEIDIINGLVVEEGRKRGIPTPANETLVEVTGRIYRGELKPDAANLKIALDALKSKMP